MASVAIGIGANTTIFSVVNAMLLRSLLGLTEPSGLVDIGRTQNGDAFDTISYANYSDAQQRITTVIDVYAYRVEPQPVSVGGELEAERIYATPVSGAYFRALGTSAAHGRLLNDNDDRRDSPHVAVIIVGQLC